MGIAASAIARVVGIETRFRDLRSSAALFLPQHIAIVAQGASASNGAYPLAPWAATGAAAGGARYGYGSPIHAALRQLFPSNGQGVGTIRVTVLPLDDDEAGVAATGSITPSGAAAAVATYWVEVAGVRSAPFVTAVGDNVATLCDKIVAAVNAVLDMPVVAADGATDVDLTAKWKGASGNDLVVRVLDESGEEPVAGLTFAVTQPASGAADPSVAPALAMLGTDWVTLVVNGLGPSNATALGLIADAGEARWDQTVRRPFVALVGNPEPDVETATSGTDGRPTDRVNAQVVAPGSVHLPVQIAAAFAREIAKVANDNPPTDYGGRPLRGLLPGADADQWSHAERELAVGRGSSTVEVRDGEIRISDVVTMYHPTGEVPPAYRHVVDVVKLQNIIYNFDAEFAKAEWNGAPLIPDGQPTTNAAARTPKAAKAAACAIIDALALAAIVSAPETAKANTIAAIDGANPKRLNLSTTLQLSGNTNILSVDLNFGFFFGQAPVV